MIVGVGLDLVEISHFKRIIQKGGVAFYRKILTPVEFKEVAQLNQTLLYMMIVSPMKMLLKLVNM